MDYGTARYTDAKTIHDQCHVPGTMAVRPDRQTKFQSNNTKLLSTPEDEEEELAQRMPVCNSNGSIDEEEDEEVALPPELAVMIMIADAKAKESYPAIKSKYTNRRRS